MTKPLSEAALAQMEAGQAADRRPGGIVGLLHAEIAPDPHQPRKHFDPQDLEDLSTSIVVDGLLQNLVVRDLPEGVQLPYDTNGVRFLIVAGERRWRAIGYAIAAGEWPADRVVPCLIKKIGDEQAEIVALVENLDRRDLSPMEEARAFQRLRMVHLMGTDEIGRRVHKTQRFVQQRLQLLELSDEDQDALVAGTLKIEQARKKLSGAASPPPPPAAPPSSGSQAPENPAAGREGELFDPTSLDARTAGAHALLDASRTAALKGLIGEQLAPVIVMRPVLAIGPASLRYEGAVELLRAIEKWPRSANTAYASIGKTGLSETAIGRRLHGFAGDGLIDRANSPTITDAGRAQLAAIEAALAAPQEPAPAPAVPLPPETLLLRMAPGKPTAGFAKICVSSHSPGSWSGFYEVSAGYSGVAGPLLGAHATRQGAIDEAIAIIQRHADRVAEEGDGMSADRSRAEARKILKWLDTVPAQVEAFDAGAPRRAALADVQLRLQSIQGAESLLQVWGSRAEAAAFLELVLAALQPGAAA